jgi:thioredoxin 1
MEHVDASAFEGTRLRRDGTVAVVFSADWCPFCRSFLPKFAALEGPVRYPLLVADLTDEDSPLWETFDIRVVPTLVGFRGGEPVFRANGHLGRGLSDRDLAALREALG